MNDNNFYAAPTAAVDDMYARTAWAEQGVLAGRGTRLGAVLLDAVPLIIVAIIAAIMISVLAVNDTGGETMTIMALIGAAIAVLAVAGVNLYLLHENGQTIGKKLLGIKIVRSDRVTRASLGRIFFYRMVAMGFIGAIPIIGSFIQIANYLWIFGEERRCLHDLLADTVVIIDQPLAQADPTARW